MPITSLYITMAEAAKELQEGYAPEAGDLYICSCKSCRESMRIEHVETYDIDYIKGRDLDNVFGPYAEMVRCSGDGFFGGFWDRRKEEDDPGFIWLPSQERLQRLILVSPFYEGAPVKTLALIYNFHHWCQTYLSEADYRDECTEILWLRYAMSHLYGKKWDGGAWVVDTQAKRLNWGYGVEKTTDAPPEAAPRKPMVCTRVILRNENIAPPEPVEQEAYSDRLDRILWTLQMLAMCPFLLIKDLLLKGPKFFTAQHHPSLEIANILTFRYGIAGTVLYATLGTLAGYLIR